MVDEFGKRFKFKPASIAKTVYNKIKSRREDAKFKSWLSSTMKSRGAVTGLASVSAAGAATIGSVAIANRMVSDAERRIESKPPVTVTTTTTVPITDEELEARINEKLRELGVKIETHTHPHTEPTVTTTTSTTLPPTTTTTAAPVTTTTTAPPTTTTTSPAPTTTATTSGHSNPIAGGKNDNGDNGGGKRKGLIKSVLDLLF